MGKILLIAMAVMSLVSFLLMGLDKSYAKSHHRRIPEKTLFLSAILFGGVGGTLGMYLFRHKTKHWYFTLFFPVFAIIQLVILFLVYR